MGTRTHARTHAPYTHLFRPPIPHTHWQVRENTCICVEGHVKILKPTHFAPVTPVYAPSAPPTTSTYTNTFCFIFESVTSMYRGERGERRQERESDRGFAKVQVDFRKRTSVARLIFVN